ncbi:glutathione-dependent formaldehyde-activating enzyme [Colletotrichum scovillei]|uniref:Glutathione-dependent formaldehyde-activating enzyme n=2 Tax=Colletotrichum scovillei TaxID=1209932 RepID=A0A9P7QVL3_9PEZI|nr:glutathione-dependent formaldehyde-activating enzyme [Colletotrichum scovillei]KAG7042337.1 glutathione-dependent formaldehyde-activating enzyme [Colletotrichum scovillei]KAG7062371.1 glutathione-dependent formaldehyde-activating enzyme [Colletotrichum scovillei]
MDEPHELTQSMRGNCHCTAVVYLVHFSEPSIATQCGCSLCIKKANLWLYTCRDDVTFVKGDEGSLTSYTFGAEGATYKFCGLCATSVMEIGPSGTQIAFNARTFQTIDIENLKLEQSDCAGHSSSQDCSISRAAEPTPLLGSLKLYTGGCHCGALTLRLRSETLDKDYKGLVLECNCRVCEMNGYIWVYPQDESVDLIGEEKDIGRYKFSHHILWKSFCKICGVFLTNNHNILTKEEHDALSENAKFWHNKSKGGTPVNVRVLDGIELEHLRQISVKFDGKNVHQPPYSHP